MTSLCFKDLGKFSAFVFFLYIMPVGMIWLGVIPFNYRFHLLVAISLMLFLYLYIKNHSLVDLGISLNNFKRSLMWNFFISAIVLVVLMLFYQNGWYEKQSLPEGKLFFIGYVFILVPLQELVFRSALFAVMERFAIRNAYWKVSISSVLFCYLHIIYNNSMALVATLFIGIIWGAVYNRCPNFWGVAISHALLGAVAILIGLI